ncbi:dephospho-CoA kinase [Gammaproteobacteria bacterium]
MKRIPLVGLTGGIGSGKSTVADRFSALGIPVIDADQVTRTLCMPGQQALAEIVEAFGPGVLDADGRLDRTSLRKRIFADTAARHHLEAILHPQVRAEMARQVMTLDTSYGILAIPLLLESGQVDLVDRVLVVDCPAEIQIRRVMARDNVPRPQVEAVLAAQTTQGTRLAIADDVLINDADIKTLHHQIDVLHHRYLKWVASRHNTPGGVN